MSFLVEWAKARDSGALVAGGFLIAVGAVGAWVGSDYDIGPLNRFGPGLFPMAVSLLLMAFGVAVIFENKPIERDFEPPSLRAIIFVTLGVVAFALLVTSYGGVAATIALVVLCAFAEDRLRPVTTVILAGALAFILVVLFVQYLGVPIRAFPWS